MADKLDFAPYFKAYEQIRDAADLIFEKMQNDFPEEVTCKLRCSDCCQAVFDLTFIEALYINYHFNRTVDDEARRLIIEKANTADRQVYRLKRSAAIDVAEGRDEADIVEEMGRARITCPLLEDDQTCRLYPYRPITCRLYGIPLSVGGKGRTCGISAFTPGKQYPTVQYDKIVERLQALSHKLVAELKSRHAKMGELLVPLSMALLTQYDDTYLGIGSLPKPPPSTRKHGKRRSRK